MKRKYKLINNAYKYKENFFVSYAVKGPMIDKEDGVRAGMPILGPITGPIKEPSPLNTEYVYNFNNLNEGIL